MGLNGYLIRTQFRVVHLTPKIILKEQRGNLWEAGKGAGMELYLFIECPSELVEILKSAFDYRSNSV